MRRDDRRGEDEGAGKERRVEDAKTQREGQYGDRYRSRDRCKYREGYTYRGRRR